MNSITLYMSKNTCLNRMYIILSQFCVKCTCVDLYDDGNIFLTECRLHCETFTDCTQFILESPVSSGDMKHV